MRLAIAVYIAIVLAAGMANRCFGWEPNPSFISYIKQVEGFRATAYSCPAGYLTIGYGHRIASNSLLNAPKNALSEREATTLLVSDLKAVYRRIESLYGNRLSNYQIEVLIDYWFNGCGPRQFPKFYKAVLANDRHTMRREYKRHYAGGRELRGRNQAFYNRYLCN